MHGTDSSRSTTAVARSGEDELHQGALDVARAVLVDDEQGGGAVLERQPCDPPALTIVIGALDHRSRRDSTSRRFDPFG
jgi:hypothetical protein